MSSPHDKQIHRDQFRLRLLVTNGCNINCSFCLNDFQPKPKGKPTFLPIETAKKAINSYLNLAYKYQFTPRINISGGEPGAYPHIFELINYIHSFEITPMVNTNGLLLKHPEWVNIATTGVDLRVSVNKFDESLAETLCQLNGRVQHVLTKDFGWWDAWYLAKKYTQNEVPIRFVVDFFGDNKLYKEYDKFIIWIQEEQFAPFVQSRFTGIQENRGPGCNGCEKKCLTVKALWVFPDGSASPCPQSPVLKECSRSYSYSWDRLMEHGYKFHLISSK